MNNYSILIVGIECYFGHIKEFVVNLKRKNPLVEVSLVISPIKDDDFKEISGFVKRIVFHNNYNGTIRFRYYVTLMNVLHYYLEFFSLLVKDKFDIVDIHFPNRRIKFAMPFIKKMTKNIVITPWGSDVLRVEDVKSINELSKVYSQARYITIGKDTPIGKCAIEKFNADPDKMVKLGWGGEFFDYVHENSDLVTTDEAKARFGLNGRYVITCGYNTQKEQRHLDIVNAIIDVRCQLPENLTLLFPFTYGRSAKRDEYTSSVKKKCKELGLHFVAVEENLDMLDLLKLRMATDMFVHVQTTDAGSRCVMEYVYCNKKVVHGSWIRYAYLDDYKPMCYFPVDNMQDLGRCIVNAYHARVGDLPQEVKRIIMERGWNYKMALWNDFFESLLV